MDSRKIVFKETAIVAIGVVICTVVMIGVYILLDKFNISVLWGAIIGTLLSILNFFFMAVGTSLAADRAEDQKVNSGKVMVKTSYLLRTVVLFVILYACVRSGLCNPISVILPLIFVQPSIFIGEFFRKGRETKQ